MKALSLAILFLLVSYGAMLFFAELKKINSYEATAWTEDHEADCGVVLTGKAYRVQEGFDLLSQQRIKKLIISGVNPKAKLSAIFPTLIYYGNIRKQDIILEKASLTTFGNAQQSYQLLEALSCRDVVLITSRIHMYRALKTFKAVMPENFPIYPRAIVSGRVSNKPIDLFIETVKSLFYAPWAY